MRTNGSVQKGMRGFTLIELLVVIAIIGLLSAVVIASLNSARSKGADAAIKDGLAQVQNQGELLYDSNSCYGTASGCNTTATAACSGTNSLFVDPTVTSMITSVQNSAGGAANVSCAEAVNGTAWSIAANLKATSGTAWCVDSTGVRKAYTGTAAAAVNAAGKCN